MRKSIFALASLLAAATVFGQATINKADNPDDLNLTTSWTGIVVPTSADIARWNNGVTGISTSLGANLVFGQIAIVDPAGLVTINGSHTLTLNGVAGVGIDMSAATQNLTLGMTGLVLGANQSWNIAAGRTLTVNAILSGSSALTKSGAGTVVLSQANTYISTTTVSAGVLNIQNATALGTAAGGTTVASGAALELQGGIVVVNEALSLNGTGISGAGGLRNISGDNSFNGTITLAGAASIISDSGLLTLDPSSGNAITAGTNALTMGGAGNITVNDAISSTGTFTKVGAGTLTINNATTPSGATAVNGGVLNLGGSGQIDGNTTVNNAGTILRISGGTDAISGNVDITLNAGTFFEYNSNTETIGALAGSGTITRTTTGTGTLTLNSGNETSTFSGLIENGTAGGVIAITKTGTGTLTLTGANTFTGTLSVANGLTGSQSLIISGAGASLATNTINVGDNNGGQESLTVGAVGDVVAGTLNRISDTANITLAGSATGGFTYVGPAAGSGGNEENIGTLTASNGRNQVTLVAGTDNEVQVTTGSIARANNGTLLIRGSNLGGTGTGSTRLVATTTTGLLTGGGGADGTTTKSIIRHAIGDSSATGSGSGFLTYDATTGVRLLTAAEYDTSIMGATPTRNVTTAGEAVTASTSVGGLRITGGGNVSIAPGQRLVVSGAVLMTDSGTATGASITGAGTLDFGATEGMVHFAQSTLGTGGITANIAGSSGVTFGRSGDAASIFELGGNNTVVGNFTINMGTVRLVTDTALNDNAPMTVIGRAATVLQLNGNSVTVRDLQTGSGNLVIENANATTATLTTYLTANRTFSTVLQNGTGTGLLNLVVSAGTSTLTLDADASATGTFEMRSGTTALSGTNGTLNDFASYTVSGGTLRLTNTSTAANANRLSGGAITLNAATLDFDNNASDASFSETVGALTLNSGASTITVDRATATNSRTSVLTLASLARSTGATVNFTSQAAGTAVFDLGTTAQSRLAITTDPTLDNGIIGGWATIDSSATTREFAKFVTGTSETVTALTTGEYTTTLTSGANAAQNVKITATQAALSTATEINSLNIQQASATTVDLGGQVLRVESGGIITSGAFTAALSNGTLTAGTGADAAGELIVHALATQTTISAVIADNGTGMVSFTKTGSGLVDLSGVTNTYTGSTYITGGTVRIDSNSNLGAPAAGQTLTLSNGTLDVTNNLTLSPDRGIVVGAGASIISVASGTANNGKVVTYNGSITGLGTTEGSLHLRSNPVATTGVDPGDFNGTLSALSLGGTFRFDAGAIGVTNASNTIGRSLMVGADGVATLTFSNAGGNLTVGQGINETLDVGVVNTDIAPGNVLLSNGTLDVSALSQFTSSTATIRIGLGGGGNRIARGALLLAQNNDLTALTSILVSQANGPSQIGQESAIVFGSGVSNVTTPLFTVGGYKGDGRVTVAAGGTVNLSGFGAGTLDLHIARNVGSTGTFAEGDFIGTGGTVNASLDELSVGLKSGGNGGGAVGVLTLGATNNVWSANSIVLGSLTGNASGSTATSGTLNFGGGAFVVNNDVAMATFSTNTGTMLSIGRLNITGGTFTIAGNITRTTDNQAQSQAFVTVDGGTLDMQNQAADDSTAGSISASQLAFRSGSIVDVASASLAAVSTTNSGVAGTTGDALIVRDVTLSIPSVAITGANGGNIHYEAAGGGSGGTISSNVDLGAVTRTVNVENSAGTTGGMADLTLSGVVSNGGITKTNTGVLLLTGANTYAGTTTVSAGTLQVGAGGVGSLAAGSTVNVSGSSAVLAGTGSINGSVTMTQGTLRPGDSAGESVGTLSTGALAFTPATAQTMAELQILAPGSADKLSISGALTLHANGNFVVLPTSYTATRGDSFTLMEWTGLLTLNGWTTGANYRNGAGDTGADLDLPDISSSGLVWEISSLLDGSTGGSLVIVVVPEPGRALLLGISMAFLLMHRRRR